MTPLDTRTVHDRDWLEAKGSDTLIAVAAKGAGPGERA